MADINITVADDPVPAHGSTTITADVTGLADPFEADLGVVGQLNGQPLSGSVKIKVGGETLDGPLVATLTGPGTLSGPDGGPWTYQAP